VTGTKEKWFLFKKVVNPLFWYLKIFHRKTLNQIHQIVADIKLDEIKSSVEDIYWQNQASADYSYRGLDYETRQKLYLEEKLTLNK